MLCNLLTDPGHTEFAIANWRAMLRHSWEAGKLDAQREALAEAIKARLHTGRPLAATDWIAQMKHNGGSLRRLL